MCRIEIFFFKQKTAYEMRISDWSSDVCSSDLSLAVGGKAVPLAAAGRRERRVRVERPAPEHMDFRHGRRRAVGAAQDQAGRHQIGRASCRERECQYV